MDAATLAPPVFAIDEWVSPDTEPIQIWSGLIKTAVRSRASDVHLAHQSDGLHVSLRVDGDLREQGRIAEFDSAARLINHVKVVGALDLGERRRPQNGRAMVKIDGRTIDLRISAMPTGYGQDIVVRILDRSVSLLEVEQLGLSRRMLNELLGVVTAPSGLVLVTGPTGAGKTTTLYAILNRLNDGTRKVITIENPVEYDLIGISQAQVNHRLGVDYASLLQTVLQQDPDVIMIGEVRDAETAATAVRAAITGHLVFATLHAISAAAAVEAIVSLGAHPHFVSRALRGVIAQNLVRCVCPHCSTRIDETAAVLPLDDVTPLLEPGAEPALAMGRGCPECLHTGYLGRRGVFEIMVNDPAIRERIQDNRHCDEIQQAAVDAGMITLLQAGKLAAFLGQTTIEEVVRKLPVSDDDNPGILPG